MPVSNFIELLNQFCVGCRLYKFPFHIELHTKRQANLHPGAQFHRASALIKTGLPTKFSHDFQDEQTTAE